MTPRCLHTREVRSGREVGSLGVSCPHTQPGTRVPPVVAHYERVLRRESSANNSPIHGSPPASPMANGDRYQTMMEGAQDATAANDVDDAFRSEETIDGLKVRRRPHAPTVCVSILPG